MKKFFLLTSLLLSTSVFAQDANEMIRKSDKMRALEGDSSFSVEVQDIKGSKATKSKYQVFNKGTAMSRVETLFPERQVGRKMLMKENDLWLFTPDIKRPTRISMQQRLTGEVANGDIASTNFADDYQAELKGEEKIDGQDALRLHLKKKRDDVTYAAIDFWIAKKDYAPMKAEFKTDGGKTLKTAIYSEPKMILNQKLFTKIEITSALNKSLKSILTYSGYKKEKLDESFFNKESLNN